MPGLHSGSDTVAARRHEVFQQLRPICSVLLQHRASPARLHEDLTALQHVLGAVEPGGLAGCWDYVMFPLMLVVDSVAPPRRAGMAGAKPAGAGPHGATAPGAEGEDEEAVPAAKSDKVAETAMGE